MADDPNDMTRTRDIGAQAPTGEAVAGAGEGCDRWLEAISARLDGEDPGIDARLLDAHIAGCASCRSFMQLAAPGPTAAPTRGPAVALAAPPVADRVQRVAAADRAAISPLVRAALAVVAAQIIGLAARGLVWGDNGDSSGHAARHLGAFAVAYGVGLLAVAWRPARAAAMLPVAQVLAGALLITAVVDIANGDVPLVGELIHLPEFVSVVLIWLIARTPLRSRSRA